MKESQDYRLSSLIQNVYTERCKNEKNKMRVSNLIYSYPSKVRSSEEEFKKYLRTYWHDTLKDCVCQVFLREGLIPYKEEFLLNNGIKGHDDITLYTVNIIDGGQNWELEVYGIVECKNYLKITITNCYAQDFKKQALYYCALRNCLNFYMVINNSNIIVVNKYELTPQELDSARIEMHEKANERRLEQVNGDYIV